MREYKTVNVVGQTFGRLRVIEMARMGRHLACVCVCSCGNVKTIRWNSLKYNYTQSCGCLASESVAGRNLKHGDTAGGMISAEWVCWHSMHQRCEDPKNKGFANYGGRGIKVCSRWSGSEGFANFLADVGRKPASHYQIDRYPNNNGNYEPGNVRWATPKENSNNRRPAKKRRREEHAAV